MRERKVGAREAYREAVDTAGLLAHFKGEGIDTHDLDAAGESPFTSSSPLPGATADRSSM